MTVRKCLKVTVHYAITESKSYILDRLTTRIEELKGLYR